MPKTYDRTDLKLIAAWCFAMGLGIGGWGAFVFLSLSDLFKHTC